MSHTLVRSASARKSTADAFLTGVMVMVLINVLQRAIGLARNLGFSIFLSEDQLGQWSLANSFFVIAPPFIVLGLPGSFGKFVEHYRQQGCLAAYLRRTSYVCLFSLIGFAVFLLLNPGQLSVWLYGHAQPSSVIVWTIVTLALLTIFNFLNEIVLSLRLVRLSSMMQFVNSAVFCALGVAAIIYSQSWHLLLPAYAAACTVALIPGLYGIYIARTEFASTRSLPLGTMWQRIVPFAAALWLTNLLTNSFELSDRFMLLHLSDAEPHVGQSLVGQFYCARIMPNLLASLAAMLGGVFLPYLSADWESQKFANIAGSMNRMLAILSVVFTGLSMASLAAAPILFDWILGGRYAAAFEIMPLSMMQATWSGLAMIAASYLLCAERVRAYAAMLACGLLLNILLNWPLIHYFGLQGAALATTIATAFLLTLIGWQIHRQGCQVQRRTVILCSLPVILITGVYGSIILMAAVAVITGRTEWLLSRDDRLQINQWLVPRLNRLGLAIRSLWLDC